MSYYIDSATPVIALGSEGRTMGNRYKEDVRYVKIRCDVSFQYGRNEMVLQSCYPSLASTEYVQCSRVVPCQAVVVRDPFPRICRFPSPSKVP